MRIYINAIHIAHNLLKSIVSPQDIVIDATAGNGNDTLLLAELVAEGGHVYAFDIQDKAINNTRDLLEEKDFINRVTLIKDSHHKLQEYVKEKVKAVIYNLGYLPGGDKEIVTEGNTTISSLSQALFLLEVNGVIVITVYTGHQGGSGEWSELKKFLVDLPQKEYDVLIHKFLNRKNNWSFTVLIQKI